MTEQLTIGYAAALLTLSALVVGLCLKSKKRLPPSPRIFGNLLDLLHNFEWIHWANHHKLYGAFASVLLVHFPDIET